MSQADYDKSRFVQALAECGLRPGDTVFCHSNIGFFGLPAGGMNAANIRATIIDGFLELLGPKGTLAVPTFTYSFPRGEAFDWQQTPSTCGILTELVRQDPRALRSQDPCYSVAAIGAKARQLTENAPVNSFGPNCFFERLLELDGVICNLNFDAASTFIHYVERKLQVPYRYDKLFRGRFIDHGQAQQRDSIIYVTDLSNALTTAEFEPFDQLAREQGLVKTARVGRGAVVTIRAHDTFELIADTLPQRPWLLTLAGKQGRQADIRPCLDTAPYTPPEHPDPSALEQTLPAWPRMGVGPGVEASFTVLNQLFSLRLHRIITGTRLADGTLVPEYWRLCSASLRDDAGQTLLDDSHSPFLVPVHSCPFQGTVDFATLRRHSHSDPRRPQAIGASQLVNANRWGLSLPHALLERLEPKRLYQVDIRVEQRFGALTAATLEKGPSGAPVVLISASLGQNDCRLLRQALSWFANQASNGRRLVLLLHPEPFSADSLIPFCLDQDPHRQHVFHPQLELGTPA